MAPGSLGVVSDPDDRPAEAHPEALRRVIEALHPTDEENERAERFATNLLETARPLESSPTPEATQPDRDALVAALAAADRRSWRRDLLMAAIGTGFGVIVTLVVSAIR